MTHHRRPCAVPVVVVLAVTYTGPRAGSRRWESDMPHARQRVRLLLEEEEDGPDEILVSDGERRWQWTATGCGWERIDGEGK